MAYYYNKHNCNHEDKISYYKKNINDPTSNFHKKYQVKEKETDSLIIDENTVYEIDQDCIKKYLKSNNNKKI